MPAVMPSKNKRIQELHRSTGSMKAALIEALDGAYEKLNIPGSWVLVATYLSPETTKGGIILTDKSQSEDLWQGSMGLVLKLGPQAFEDDDMHRFHGWKAKEGDWVLFRFSSAWEQHLNGVSVRWVPDTEIKAIIDDPALIAS